MTVFLRAASVAAAVSPTGDAAVAADAVVAVVAATAGRSPMVPPFFLFLLGLVLCRKNTNHYHLSLRIRHVYPGSATDIECIFLNTGIHVFTKIVVFY